jgi:hypothetical protein
MHAIQKTMDGWMCIKKKSSREMNLFGWWGAWGPSVEPLVSLGVYGWSPHTQHRAHYRRLQEMDLDMRGPFIHVLNVKARTSQANICNDVSPRRILHTHRSCSARSHLGVMDYSKYIRWTYPSISAPRMMFKVLPGSLWRPSALKLAHFSALSRVRPPLAFNLSSLKAIKPAASITFAAGIELEHCHAISLKGTKINEAINVNKGASFGLGNNSICPETRILESCEILLSATASDGVHFFQSYATCSASEMRRLPRSNFFQPLIFCCAIFNADIFVLRAWLSSMKNE